MTLRPLLAAPLVLLTAAALGCGAPVSSESEFEGDEKDVAAVVEDLQAAAGEDDPETVCDTLLAPSLTRGASNCEKAVEAAFDDTDSAELTVDAVKITGTTATADVFLGADEERKVRMSFQKSGDSWKITNLGEPLRV